jgi:hypothetical protein
LVLSEVEKVDRMDALFAVVESEYRENSNLQNACTRYRQAARQTRYRTVDTVEMTLEAKIQPIPQPVHDSLRSYPPIINHDGVIDQFRQLLRPNAQHRFIHLQGEGEISLRRLIKESLRMRPSRIIVGEVRESEALDLLIALNSGLPGMGTLHANSARDAVAKLQILPLLAGENISHRFIAPTIASAIDLIVHVSLDRNGVRRVSEIAVVTGRIEGLTPEVDSLFTWNTETSSYVRGLGSLPHPERFARLDSELIQR